MMNKIGKLGLILRLDMRNTVLYTVDNKEIITEKMNLLTLNTI